MQLLPETMTWMKPLEESYLTTFWWSQMIIHIKLIWSSLSNMALYQTVNFPWQKQKTENLKNLRIFHAHSTYTNENAPVC